MDLLLWSTSPWMVFQLECFAVPGAPVQAHVNQTRSSVQVLWRVNGWEVQELPPSREENIKVIYIYIQIQYTNTVNIYIYIDISKILWHCVVCIFLFRSPRLNEKVWSYRLSVATVLLILCLLLYLLVVCYYLPHHDKTVRMVFGFLL